MAYDAKAVKIGKPVKVLAATILDKTARKAFIRSYVKVAEAESRGRSTRSEKK